MMAPPVLLYSSSGCHLCELAEALLAPLLRAGLLNLQVVEISGDEELVRRYGTRIPVLVSVTEVSRAELGWPFDQAQVWSWLSQANLMCQGS